MAAPIVTCMVPLSHNICGSEVFSWSLDHKTAIATDHCVYIMDIQCSSSDSSKSFTLPKSVIPASEKSLEFDVQISEETVLENIQLKPSESLATMTLDPTLSPRIGLPEVYLGYKMVKWSPLHCDQQGRSLLCCLTMDHRLTIYKHMAVKKWEKIIDVSELLYSTVKENKFKFPHHLTPDVHKPFIGKCEIYERYKKRHYMLAVIAMEWSDLYHSHKDTTLTPAKKMKIEKVAEKFTLLATLNRSSHVVIWKLMTPIISENSLTIHGVIDTSFETPVSLSWCHLSGLSSDSLSNQYGIFAVGDISGQIVVWKMDVHCRQSGSLDSLTVWEDKDLLSPSKMTWKYMANKDIYILAAAKGAYLMIFMIKIKDNKLILVSKYQPSTVHPVSITGLSFQDNIIMTLSMEGTIKKTIIKVEQNAISSETQPVLLNANEKEIRKYHYVVLSPNCVYAAFVTSLLNNITKKTKVEVQIMEVCNESELLKYLLAIKGSLSNYVDTIEYIRQHIVSDNLSQPLQQFMKSTETTPALIKLGLFIQRIQLNQVKQTLSGKTVTEGEEISDDIKELKSQENQLVKMF
uniref:General transcription factor 3C polypeptide 4-like n=1 Tax=Saccoglossus kowalevskii TaxID=10224 RepID=A0ABM0MFM8_SACKO|nr:PREDICTED: general transcription factor 3C polypeptide 4-like [Saccoglossus kowalevskii]